MPDTQTPEARVVRAALELAAERPWGEVALVDIAARSRITLSDLRRHFGSKAAIVAAFARTIDDELLKEARPHTDGASPRDRVFEVVMARFDRLQPHRAALRSIHGAGLAEPVLMRAVLESQAWMLNAAGVATDGLGGGVRVAGLASVYASVFATWLDDDDPGLARTMAALDRRLRRGERTLGSLEEVAGVVKRLGTLFVPWGSGGPASRADTAASSDHPAAGPAAPAPGP